MKATCSLLVSVLAAASDERIDRLEREVAELREAVAQLRARIEGSQD